MALWFKNFPFKMVPQNSGIQGKVLALLLQYGDFRTWGWWSTDVLCQGKDGWGEAGRNIWIHYWSETYQYVFCYLNVIDRKCINITYMTNCWPQVSVSVKISRSIMSQGPTACFLLCFQEPLQTCFTDENIKDLPSVTQQMGSGF